MDMICTNQWQSWNMSCLLTNWCQECCAVIRIIKTSSLEVIQNTKLEPNTKGMLSGSKLQCTLLQTHAATMFSVKRL